MIMWRRIRVAAAIAFVGGMVGAVLIVWRLREMRSREIVPLIEALAPGVSHRIEQFDRRSYKEGRLVWEIRAELAEYSEETQEARVLGIHARWYPENGRRVEIRSASGLLRLSPDLREVQQFSLRGDVFLAAGEYELRVKAAEYNREAHRLLAPGEVDMVGPGLTVEGRGLEVDVDRATLRVGGRVWMRFAPNQLEEGVRHVPS